MNPAFAKWPDLDKPYVAPQTTTAQYTSGKLETPPVFHYTDRDGFVGILDSKTIRATDVLYLNDTEEMAWGRGTFIDAATTRAPALLKERVDQIVAALLPSRVLSFCVVCFSEDGDELSQWRGYAKGGGYAIEFPHVALRALQAAIPMTQIAKVEYNANAQAERANFIADQLYARIATVPGGVWSPNVVEREASHLGAIVATEAVEMKSKKFAAEQEWRLIAHVHLEKATLRSRPGRFMLRPFAAFSFEGNLAVLDSIRVKVGPGPHQELDERAAGMLLNSIRSDPSTLDGLKRASRSSIPYRDV